MKDILGKALHDFYYENKPGNLWIHNQYGPKEEMPVDVFFRDDIQMPELELKALNHCRGKVLDIGAGAGSHTLILQQKGFDVRALDISGLGVSVMKSRGVKMVEQADIFKYNDDKYDTLLLLMNGIGLVGTLDYFKIFLKHANSLLLPGGQLLFDSSDIAYLYADAPPPTNNYYGELYYQYEYKRQRTEWFKWLYIDKLTMFDVASHCGWCTEILFEDEYDQYLTRLTLK